MGEMNVSSTPVEHYDYGIRREWLDDHQIVMISTQGDMSRDAVDTWAELVIATAKNWTADKPIYIIHNLSARSQGFTPYSRQRAEETYDYIAAGQQAYIALVLPDGVIPRLVSLFLRRRKGSTGNIQERIFTSVEDALAWIRRMQQPDK